jgi:hypothetical protein
VGPRAGLGEVAKKKGSLPCRESKLSRSAQRTVIILTELPQLISGSIKGGEFLD